jgi:hypothetical protein
VGRSTPNRHLPVLTAQRLQHRLYLAATAGDRRDPQLAARRAGTFPERGEAEATPVASGLNPQSASLTRSRTRCPSRVRVRRTTVVRLWRAALVRASEAIRTRAAARSCESRTSGTLSNASSIFPPRALPIHPAELADLTISVDKSATSMQQNCN